MASSGQIVALIIFILLILGFGIGLVLTLMKECGTGYYKQPNGVCYQQLPIFTCVNTNVHDPANGNTVYVVASAQGNYGCLTAQNSTNTCLSYDSVTDCNAALNQPYSPTGAAYPNVATVPMVGTNIYICQASDYNSSGSFCSYMNANYTEKS